MAHKKRRVAPHMMETESRQIVEQILPTEWVVRNYVPDYGIDVAVEIFDRIDGLGKTAETAGEWFFAQIKSIQRTDTIKKKVYPRDNVEKVSQSDPYRQPMDQYFEIDVIRCRIDTDTLLTVQSLGSGVPVILFLVTLDTKQLYFVCLNDFIDKCVIPADPDFSNKRSTTVYIPVENRISGSQLSVVPIRFLAKRMKLYSAFAKFTYQGSELPRLFGASRLALPTYRGDPSSVGTLLHFIGIIKRYDFWDSTDMWAIVPTLYGEILLIERMLKTIQMQRDISTEELAKEVPELRICQSDQGNELDCSTWQSVVFPRIESTWRRLRNLNNVYEECCREWFLPTYFAQLASSGPSED